MTISEILHDLVILRCERSAPRRMRNTGRRPSRRALRALLRVTGNQLSRNDLSFRNLDGCFNFRSALALICRIRSLVTEKLLADFFHGVVGVHADAEAHAHKVVEVRLFMRLKIEVLQNGNSVATYSCECNLESEWA